MKKIRTLIVDDESLARERLRQLLQQEPEIELIGESSHGREAVSAIQNQAPDLVFLDVQMPELDGFRVLELIPAESMPVVVFVTAHEYYALRAFEVHAVDYLLKPFDRQRFQKALRHAIDQVRHSEASARGGRHAAMLAGMKTSTAPERLTVKTGGSLVWVATEEIDWIGSADNYAELHLGAKSHLLRETLGALEARLPPERFVRISRSAIVNAARIRELKRLFYGGYELTLQNGKKLTLSRRYRDKLPKLGLE